ncbi:MAG: DNA polymerase III subunit alpha, partial [Acidimicrobiia bacterium]|nr:DNA polymerase III subunit alpha [Acidimicrobiia bacterium]
PDAADMLSDTFGLMVFQEQMMRVAQRFAGYSLAEADNLRKACGKKVRELMAKERASFVVGCERTGYGEALGTQLFDVIEQFADYAFNKSHSYGYGYIAYQIAYLKAHYPIEYLSALLTSVKSSLEKAAVYLNECRVMGIEVVVPDINLSRSDFHPLPDLDETDSLGQIVFGLSAVRNVGVALVELILAEREHNGPFTSFIDFCERVDLMVLNKRTIESMIKAGTFDSLGHPRKGLLTVYEQIIDLTVARRREHDMGVMSLFGELDGGPSFDERPTIPDIEFDKMERLRFEKEMLGLYISDHPVMGYEAALRRRCDSTIGQLAEANDGDRKRIGGVITNLQKKWTRKGDLMAIFELEDLEASIEVMVFPKTMTEHGHKLTDDVIAVVQGRVERRDDLPKMFAQTIDIFDTTQTDVARPLRIQLAPNGLREETIERLQGLLADHPGDSPVLLHVGSQVVRLPDDTRADTRRGLVAELRVLLGPDAVVV